MITPNRVPKSWAQYHRKVLTKAIGDTPIITISNKPLDWGINLLQTEYGHTNLYKQILRGAKLATTKYIAIAEDDTLYPKEHFEFYRPDEDTFAYNNNRFALFTWGTPIFSWREGKVNCSLIAPRQLTIEALEERFQKYPNGTPQNLTGELGREEEALGLSPRKSYVVYSTTSIIQFNHDFSVELYQRNHKKKLGPIRAFDIPYWGKAADLVTHFK